MKRNYKFYDKESTDPIRVQYEFDSPFYENLDKHLKELYGNDLTFVKLIDHKSKIIKLHTGYDSGKGTVYVKPYKYGERTKIRKEESKLERFDSKPVDVSMYNTKEDLEMLLNTGQKNKAIGLYYKLYKTGLKEACVYVCDHIKNI